MNQQVPPAAGELSAKAQILEGSTHNGKPCRLVDNTGEIAPAELQQLLQQLIADKHFGIKGLSGPDGTLKLGEPQITHIQFGEKLYRLVLFPFEARIETF